MKIARVAFVKEAIKKYKPLAHHKAKPAKNVSSCK
jgi:hypothetical protein